MIQLYTDRLLIREHLPQDLDTHHQLFSNREVMHYVDGLLTTTREESTENLQLALAEMVNPDRQHYFFRVEERDNGALVGEIGYSVLAAWPQGTMVEMGYFTFSHYWGQGYTTEAARELLRFSFRENGVYRVVCGCLKENVGSERVMQKCGMTKEAELKEYQLHQGVLKDRVQYRLLKHEWEGQQ